MRGNTNNMLNQSLIENALALTGKTMEDMKELIDLGNNDAGYCFSIEKFCYYLLSPEFIEKYTGQIILIGGYTFKYDVLKLSHDFGKAIYEYQLGNEEPLSNLLSKIGTTVNHAD